MPPTLATPENAQSKLDAGVRNISLAPGSYDALYVREATGTMQSIVGSGRDCTFANGIHIQGRPQGVHIATVTVRGDGIQSVDGVDHLTIADVGVEDVTGQVGIAVTGHDATPVTNLSMNGVRVRRCPIGIMLGQGIRWDIYDGWADQCQSALNAADPSCHGFYGNDDNNIAGNVHGFLITRCGGTSFRGTGSRAYDCIAWMCGGTMAGSRNCEMMTRFTSLDSGAIEIGTQVPCVVEDPYGPVQIKGSCRSQWLQILRPRFAPGQGITDDVPYPIHDVPVPGRNATLTVIDPQQIETITRTPADFCRDVLGGTADLESLWGKSFSVAAMNKYLRGIA